MKRIILNLIVIIIFALSSFSQSTPMWANSVTGIDVELCGLKPTLPCKSLNFILSRNLSEVELEIDGIFQKEDIYFPYYREIIITTSDGAKDKARISNALIRFGTTGLFQISNVILNKVLLTAYSLNMVDVIVVDSNVTSTSDGIVTSTYFNNSKSYFQKAQITNSHFYASPVRIRDVASIVDSRFENSTSDSALTLYNSSTVANSSFFGNGNFDLNGGAISFPGGYTLTILWSNFTNNRGDLGGAIYVQSNLLMNNSIISANSARQNGGGIYVKGMDNFYNFTLANTLVINNTAVMGGGAFLNREDFYCENSVFTSNFASENGGGLYVATGFVALKGNSCQVSLNRANNGGGISLDKPTSGYSITGFTIASNFANSTGGGVYITGDGSLFENSIFFSNTANQIGNSIYATDMFSAFNLSFSHSKNDDVFLGGNEYSIYSFFSWNKIVFADPDSNTPLNCAICSMFLCPAVTNCDDCFEFGGKRCIQIGPQSICVLSDNFCACDGISCKNMNKGHGICNCYGGWTGDGCTTPIHSSLHPVLVVLLIGAGLVVGVLVIFVWRLVQRRNRK